MSTESRHQLGQCNCYQLWVWQDHMVDQGDRQDPTGKSRRYKQRWRGLPVEPRLWWLTAVHGENLQRAEVSSRKVAVAADMSSKNFFVVTFVSSNEFMEMVIKTVVFVYVWQWSEKVDWTGGIKCVREPAFYSASVTWLLNETGCSTGSF